MALQVAVDVGAGIGIMSAMAVVHGKVGQVHAVEAIRDLGISLCSPS